MCYDTDIIVKESHISARASGPSSLVDNVDLCRRVLRTCEVTGRKRVLVDVRGITETPGVIDIYQMAKEIDHLIKDRIEKCALVQKVGDAEAFTEKVMRHRGLNLRSFQDEEAAVFWLNSREDHI